MSDATVVVEAGWRSGSLNTAGHAAALGRPLGAVPGPITSATSAGCHRLLREFDATCVTSASEVIELTGWEAHPSKPTTGTRTGVSVGDAPLAKRAEIDAATGVLPDAVSDVLDALGTRARRSAEEIARRAGLVPAQVEAQLGLFELEGLVVREDGGWRRAAARPAQA